MRQLLIAATLIALPFTAAAQDDPALAAVKAREGFMQMVAFNMGTLAAMAKGDIAYDEGAATTAGANLDALGQYDFPGLFIAGSAPGDGVESGALPGIWEDPEGFAEKFAAFREASAGAGAALAGGQDSIGPVLQAMGGTCKECHDDFRKK